MSTILVITGERNWTQRAVHLAGATARETGASVVILHMVRVAHLEYLGAGAREALLPYDDYNALAEYAAIVDTYGIGVGVDLFEYSDYVGGLLSAAELHAPLAVFAPAPVGPLAFLTRLRLWGLRRALRRPLYTLGQGDPSITITSPAEEGVETEYGLAHSRAL